jgi:hypothetical protein
MLILIQEQCFVSEPIETDCLNFDYDSIKEYWNLAICQLGRVRIFKVGWI